MAPSPNPAGIVADADVLAADVLIDGPARRAMDLVRSHGWISLYYSEPVIEDTVAVLETIASATIASEWRTLITALGIPVEHPPDDHPAIGAALSADAANVLSYDESLLTAAAGTAIRTHGETSVKRPDAFVRLFDPERVYPVVVGGAYPGPDRDPRDH